MGILPFLKKLCDLYPHMAKIVTWFCFKSEATWLREEPVFSLSWNVRSPPWKPERTDCLFPIHTVKSYLFEESHFQQQCGCSRSLCDLAPRKALLSQILQKWNWARGSSTAYLRSFIQKVTNLDSNIIF